MAAADSVLAPEHTDSIPPIGSIGCYAAEHSLNPQRPTPVAAFLLPAQLRPRPSLPVLNSTNEKFFSLLMYTLTTALPVREGQQRRRGLDNEFEGSR